MCDLKCVVRYFSIFWYLTSYPLYIVVVVCLFYVQKFPDFDAPFYKIITSLGCIDLLNFGFQLFGFELIQWGWWSGLQLYDGPLGGISYNIFNYLMMSTSIGQHLGVLLVAIDRFSQFVVPVFHHKLWSNGKLKVALFLHWFLSFSIGIPSLRDENQFMMPNVTDDGVTFVQCENMTLTAYHAFGNLFLVSAASVVLFCYGAILFKALIIFNEVRNSHAKRLALQTTLIGFSLSFCLLCFMAFGLLSAFQVSIFGLDQDTYMLIFLVIGDLYTGLNPYCLLLFARNFREKAIHFLCCYECGVKVGPNEVVQLQNFKPKLVPRPAQAFSLPAVEGERRTNFNRIRTVGECSKNLQTM